LTFSLHQIHAIDAEVFHLDDGLAWSGDGFLDGIRDEQ
jgi:hypothetical protein